MFEKEVRAFLDKPLHEMEWGGVMDRLDHGIDGDVIVDYKTGRAPKSGNAALDAVRGRKSQGPLYLLLAEKIGRPSASFAYSYVLDEQKIRLLTTEEWEQNKPAIVKTMHDQLELMKGGCFLPMPDDYCGLLRSRAGLPKKSQRFGGARSARGVGRTLVGSARARPPERKIMSGNQPADHLDREAAATPASTKISSSLAGAGTGKTTLLINRLIQLLLVKEIPVERIVALTFTKKAAEEMRERLEDRLREENSALALQALNDIPKAQIGTIHSFAGSRCCGCIRYRPASIQLFMKTMAPCASAFSKPSGNRGSPKNFAAAPSPMPRGWRCSKTTRLKICGCLRLIWPTR